MEIFTTRKEYVLLDMNQQPEICIPAGIFVKVEHVSGHWHRLTADCFLTAHGNTSVVLGDLQIRKLKGEIK